jgi:hypothetical protein
VAVKVQYWVAHSGDGQLAESVTLVIPVGRPIGLTAPVPVRCGLGTVSGLVGTPAGGVGTGLGAACAEAPALADTRVAAADAAAGGAMPTTSGPSSAKARLARSGSERKDVKISP